MKIFSKVFLPILLLFLLVAAPTLTLAASVRLSWQPNSEPDLQSYNVYYGTQSRNYGPPIPVDQNTTCTIPGLAEGSTYYFAVTAVDTSSNESGYSGEISGSIPVVDDSYQLVWSPNDRSNPTSLDHATISGDGYISLVPETSVVQVDFSIDGQFHNTERYAPFDIGEPVHTTSMSDGSHVISTRVTLENGTTLDFDTTCTVANAQTPPPDTTAPEIHITDPTSGAAFTTSSATIDLAGSASDNQALQQVAWTTSNGGSGTASGTANWTVQNIPLAEGNNTITLTATDTSGNPASATITVTFNPVQADDYQVVWSPNDRSNPTSLDHATISGDGYISLVPETSVVQVDFSIDGQFHNTERYAPFDIGEPVHTTSMSDGSHVISTRVTLENGTTLDFDTTCTVANAQTPPPDTTAPEIRITDPTSGAAFTTSAATIDLAGSASDNQALQQVAWTTSNGGSGTASGTANWTVQNIPLTEGNNTITLTATDTSGNTSNATLSVEYSPADTAPPLIQILSPTSSDTYAAGSSSISLSGTASDDNAIASIEWSSSFGQSGIAAGTSSWSISGINLAGGDTAITVTAIDHAGNSASDKLTVTYHTADTLAPIVHMTSPTSNKSFFSRTDSVSIAGTASDEVGIAKVTWRNSRGENGTCTGTDNWQASGIRLDRWWNTITVTAMDHAGNTDEYALKVFRWK